MTGVLAMPSERLSLGTLGPCGSWGKMTQVLPLPPAGSVSSFNHFNELTWKLWFPTWNEAVRMVEGIAVGITCCLPSTFSLVACRETVSGVLVRLTRTSLAARNLLPVVR